TGSADRVEMIAATRDHYPRTQLRCAGGKRSRGKSTGPVTCCGAAHTADRPPSCVAGLANS
ncbi:MAG: hypothetical protein IJI45_09565, partial [Anaerolineaceae bacterium]|nr:hypothetical protein [Anaerolineaceae bacterium]